MIAAIAPVVAAGVMWLVTGSVFALVFAALGPVTAVASWVDSRWGNRRLHRRESQRFATELGVTRATIAQVHASELAALDEVTPAASVLVERFGSDPYRWSATLSSPLEVRVGRGTVPSALALDPIPSTRDSHLGKQLHALTWDAARLESAPVTVDPQLGIGVSGPLLMAHAAARALAVQLAWALSPAEHWWASSSEEVEWLAELPHSRRVSTTRGSLYEFGHNDAQSALVVVAVAAIPAQLPGACRVVLDLQAGGAALLRHPDPAIRGAVSADVVSREQCIRWARRIHRDATADGIVAPHSGVPSAAELGPLLRRVDDHGRGSLACEPAVSAVGPVRLDLVTDGPHAVVGGTTGSGKSELLIAWVLAMAAPRSPDDVTFLLVDFKGGSAFAALARLPHTVGIITDLDQAGARRALDSLRAELRFRERLLVAEAVRSIDETTACARLVIVVDEFAAMLAEHPELHSLFADLAARGRSLGIHLLLCTQRPAGVVRDAVLANADLRVSLRVNNRADSSAVVGSDAAAAIPLQAKGRAIISRGGASGELVQFALASARDVDVIADRWASVAPPRRPWREPLPTIVAPADVPPVDEGYAFGLCDLPEEQRWDAAVYRPPRDGHLLVLGSSGCGKSTALAAIGQAASAQAAGAQANITVRFPRECDAAWDTICEIVARLDTPTGLESRRDTLVLLDDLDSLVARFGSDHRAGFTEMLARVLRDGPARGIRVVISAQRVTPETQSLVASVPARLMMRHASRQDFVIAGGDGTQYLADLPAGGGVWRGHRVQVARFESVLLPDAAAHEVELCPGRPLAIVTTHASQVLSRYPDSVALSETQGDPRVLAIPGAVVVGDVEEWQSRWGAIASLRPVADILFDGCSIADYRALTRSRHIPPPISPGLCWRLNEDGTASRARLPR